MSSRYWPNYAWALRATAENLEALGITKKMLYDAFHEEYLTDEQWKTLSLEEMYDEIAFSGAELTIDVDGQEVCINMLYLSDENDIHRYTDDNDNTSDTGAYIEIHQDALYETTPKPLHGKLLDRNLKFPRIDWVSYG